MKITKYIIIFLAFIQYSYAAKVSDLIKVAQGNNSASSISINTDSINKILTDTMTSVQNDIMKELNTQIQKVQDTVQGNVNNVLNKFDTQIQGVVDNVNNNIIGKAEKLVNDATEQYNSIITAKDGVFSVIQSVMDNLPTYILIAKIIIGAIVLGLFLLIFLFWLSYRNAKKMVAEMKKLMIDKDLQEVNRKLDEILAKLK